MLRNPDQILRPAKTTFLLNALAASMLLTQHAHALSEQAPTAGVSITNTASAAYIFDGVPTTQPSNTVAVQVAALYAITLTSAPEQQVYAGDLATWLNTLTNTSNSQATVSLSALTAAGLIDPLIYHDKNNNGTIDDGELLQDVIVLARGQSVQLIVTARADATLNAGDQRTQTIQASVVEDPSLVVQATDPLVIIAPELTAIKQVDKASIDPSANNTDRNLELTYTLTVQTRGGAAVRPTELEVDNQKISGIVVRDPLPANTSFVSVTPARTDAIVLYSVRNQLSRTAPTDLSLVDEVVVVYPSLGLNATETIELVALTNSGVTNTNLRNVMRVDYGRVGGGQATKEAQAETQVLGNADIDTKTPDFGDTSNQGRVNEPLYIEVNAATCNASRTEVNKVWLRITSRLTGDVVRVLAVETGPNTGVYRHELPTAFGTDPIIEAADQTQVLQIIGKDEALVELTDCADENDQPTNPQSNIRTVVSIAPFSASLFVQKQVHNKDLEVGDFADYTVTIKNVGDGEATKVQMADTLPIGFAYVPGSTRVTYTINGRVENVVRSADPAGGQGRFLTLDLKRNLPSNSEAKVVYRVHIGANALAGDGVNRVRANATTPENTRISSNEAQAKVEVSAGVFMSDALIIGKVYADCNRDGIQDTGERGVPGVRLYLEDGSFVVTDSEGKYSFYGISAKTHTLKLDRTSLPAGVELIEQSNRHAGDPSSRFVDLKRGELHRADFAMVDQNSGCSEPLNQQIEERRKVIGDQNTALEQALRADLSTEVNYRLGDVRGLAASGCISSGSTTVDCNVSMPNPSSTVLTEPRMVNVEKVQRPITVDLEEALKTADNNSLTVLNLKDGQTLPFAQTNLQLKAVANTKIEVLVNGVAVAEDRVGKRAVLADRQIAGLDYIGLSLKSGQNTIEVRQFDQMGNLRDSKTLVVIAPDNMSQIQIQLPDGDAPQANGRDVLNAVVSVLDQNGVLVSSRTPITLDSSIGKIQLEDLDPSKAGIQQFVEGGRLLVPILSPAQAGQGRLEVASGSYQAAQPLRFVPELRPMIAAGIVEGTISLNDFDPKQLGQVSRDDGFEAELRELSNNSGGELKSTGRAAFFLKGKVKGEYLLTMAYDSDKDSKNERLFRDIRPDEYYPVYGDASAKGFDAQSTSKLYVRLDRGRSYAMYGDLTTRVDNDEGLALGQYSRTLTGLKAAHETDRLNVSGFAARTTSRQIVSEQRGLGTSGPYVLDNVPLDALLANSEKVEVITRNRENPGQIIKVEPYTRFVHYQVDTLTNSIYLTDPLSSQDDDSNPKSLRITVESDEGGEEYTVGGVAARYKINDQVKVGGSYAKSDDPLTKEELVSANAVVVLSDRAKVIAEVAHSNNIVNPLNQSLPVNASASPTGEQSGTAARVELTYKLANTDIRVYHSQADRGFYNAASPISAGRKETGAKLQTRIPELGLARLEAIRTEDNGNNGVRDGFSASLERAINSHVSLEVGARTYRETTAPSTADSVGATATDGTTLRAKLNVLIPKLEGSSAFAEYEQDISDAERKVIAVGGSYQVGSKGRIYARHELASSISGLYGLNDRSERNSTVIGIDSNYMRDGSVFSEYRLRDGIGAREAEAALGLRNRWSLGKGILLSTGLERIETLKSANNASTQDATAVTLGIEYLAHPDWKGVAKLEGRWADRSDSYSNTLGLAYKASDDVTLLAKNTFRLIDNKQGGDRTLDRFQLGAAYRDFDSNRFDALTKFEYRLDDDQTSASNASKREAFIVSAHANYHPVRRLTLASQYAAKYVEQDFNGLSSAGTTQLVAGRMIYDLNERWDASLNAGLMWSDQTSGVKYLLGAEVGYLVAANLWVSGGYNFSGYRDDDLTEGDTTVQGAYLRLRFKFDEDLLKIGVPSVNKSMEPQQ